MYSLGFSSRKIKSQLVDVLPQIWRFAFSLSGSAEGADDLTQATCLRVIEKASQFKRQGSFVGWCLTICRSIWVTELRAEKIRRDKGFSVAQTDAYETLVPHAETHVFAREIFDKVMELPETQRTVVELVYVQQYKYTEAAKILDVPIGTVMSRLHAARKTIKAFSEVDAQPQLRKIK